MTNKLKGQNIDAARGILGPWYILEAQKVDGSGGRYIFMRAPCHIVEIRTNAAGVIISAR
mgnify:CR=1 FL=1